MALKVSYENFWRTVTRDGKAPCALKGARCHRCHGAGCLRCQHRGWTECDGPMDAHHYCPKRRLRTPAAKTDVRNGVPLCRDHHDLVEQGYLLAPRPAELEFFLSDHTVPPSAIPGPPPELNLR